ncbi:MAG: type II toxin-antitoxin system HicB family antitoxin [Mangrovibacterium sp.]
MIFDELPGGNSLSTDIFVIFVRIKILVMEYSVIIEKSEDGYYVGQLQELPEVIAQGKTLEELNSNLLDALNLVLEYHREQTLGNYKGRNIIRQKLHFV